MTSVNFTFANDGENGHCVNYNNVSAWQNLEERLLYIVVAVTDYVSDRQHCFVKPSPMKIADETSGWRQSGDHNDTHSGISYNMQ